MDQFKSYLIIMAPLLAGIAVAQTLERFGPWKKEPNADALKWLQAALLYLTGILLAHGVLPISQTAASLWARDGGFGVLNQFDTPLWAGVLIALVAGDLWDYARHRALHRWSALWRIHRLHHSPTHIDVSAAFRFHPIEALITAFGHLAVAVALGAPPEAFVIRIVISVVVNFWGHANVRWPNGLQRRLSAVIITPNLHRLHHGAQAGQMGSNFGFILSVWDRAFGTLSTPSKDCREFHDLEFGLGDASRLSFDATTELFIDPLRRD